MDYITKEKKKTEIIFTDVAETIFNLNLNFLSCLRNTLKDNEELLKLNNFDNASLFSTFKENKTDKYLAVDETANIEENYDIVHKISDTPKSQLKLYSFNKIYTQIEDDFGTKEADAWLVDELTGALNMHDAFSSALMPYCYAYDITRLAKEGLFFLNKQSNAYDNEPAQHLDSFVNLLKEYISFTANRQSGAVGLPNLLLWFYYFWKKDVINGYNGLKPIRHNEDDTYTLGIENYEKYENHKNIIYLKQQIQSFIYAINQPYLRGTIQSAFTNVSIFDHEYAHALFDGVTFPDGTYAYECIEDIINIEKIFLIEVSAIRKKNMFTFPVISTSFLTEEIEVTDNVKEQFSNKRYYEIAKEFLSQCKEKNIKFVKFIDEDFVVWSSDHNCEFMDSNFFIDSEITSLSNCCRLSSNIKELGYFNSIGGTALSVGSVKVNTINLAQIAYKAIKDNDNEFLYKQQSVEDTLQAIEDDYIKTLKTYLKSDLIALDAVRKIIVKNKEKGLLPNIQDGLIDLKSMYNTVGFIGIYEALQALQNFESKLTKEQCSYISYDPFNNCNYEHRAETFISKVFDTIHKSIDFFRDENKIDYLINCEQIPGETVAKRLMEKDKLKYPEYTITSLPLYGNQFLPLAKKAILGERARIASLFDSFANGGSILHINFESGFSDLDAGLKWIIWIAQKKVKYAVPTTKISTCGKNHAFFGNVCPYCGDRARNYYQRIVGFYVPMNNWTESRKQEGDIRQTYSVDSVKTLK